MTPSSATLPPRTIPFGVTTFPLRRTSVIALSLPRISWQWSHPLRRYPWAAERVKRGGHSCPNRPLHRHARCRLEHRARHLRLRDARPRERRAAVREAEAEHGLRELVRERPRVHHRDGQVLGEVRVRLVHRRRAEADDVGTVLDAGEPRLDELREDDLLLAA